MCLYIYNCEKANDVLTKNYKIFAQKQYKIIMRSKLIKAVNMHN